MSYTLQFFFVGLCSIYVCSCSTPSFSSPANSAIPVIFATGLISSTKLYCVASSDTKDNRRFTNRCGFGRLSYRVILWQVIGNVAVWQIQLYLLSFTVSDIGNYFLKIASFFQHVATHCGENDATCRTARRARRDTDTARTQLYGRAPVQS